MSEKYVQYADLLNPLLEAEKVTRSLLGVWSLSTYSSILQLLCHYYIQSEVVWNHIISYRNIVFYRNSNTAPIFIFDVF